MNLRILLSTLATLSSLTAIAYAGVGDECDTSEDCDDGERCRKNVCVQRKSPSTPNNPISKSVPSRGATCCDQFGNGRCMINNAPQPIGSGCVCFGQGYGVVCR